MKHTLLKLAIFSVWMMFNVSAVAFFFTDQLFEATAMALGGLGFAKLTGPIFRKP